MCKLERNVFEFNSKFLLKTSWTAEGTEMAPACAYIFMAVFEHDPLATLSYKRDVWFRFIDDIFMIRTRGRKKHLLTFLNSLIV